MDLEKAAPSGAAFFCSSSRRRPGSRASVFSCRVIATWLACRGLPPSCRRPGHFLLLAQEKVTKEKGPPDDAPCGPSGPPGARVGCGVFRQGILPWRKTGRHPCRPPCGLILHPPAASYGVPRGPRAKSQEPSSTWLCFREHPPLTPALSPEGRGRSGVHRVDMPRPMRSEAPL